MHHYEHLFKWKNISGYNAEDLEAKYGKYHNVSDSSVDQLNNSMGQLNQVSVALTAQLTIDINLFVCLNC